jgi:hypothetical protein
MRITGEKAGEGVIVLLLLFLRDIYLLICFFLYSSLHRGCGLYRWMQTVALMRADGT